MAGIDRQPPEASLGYGSTLPRYTDAEIKEIMKDFLAVMAKVIVADQRKSKIEPLGTGMSKTS